MHIRDLFIHSKLSQQKVYENLQDIMKQFGKSIQSGSSIKQENVYYIVQPEDLLLVIESTESSNCTEIDPVKYPTHVRFQPYNLPDPKDQEKLLKQFPEKLIRKLKCEHPDWTLELRPFER